MIARFLVAVLLAPLLVGCVSRGEIVFPETSEPTLWLCQEPVAVAFTHPWFAYGDGAQWESVELMTDGVSLRIGKAGATRKGKVRGRWVGPDAVRFWKAVVESGRFRAWTRPYQLGDSNAFAKWLNSLSPLPGFDLGSGAYGEGN